MDEHSIFLPAHTLLSDADTGIAQRSYRRIANVACTILVCVALIAGTANLNDIIGLAWISPTRGISGWADTTFETVDGGLNRACRGKNSSDNNPINYVTVNSVDTVEACQDVCAMMPGCQGIEFCECGRCEVWLEEVLSTVASANFMCLRRTKNLPAFTQPALVTPNPGLMCRLISIGCLAPVTTTTTTTTPVGEQLLPKMLPQLRGEYGYITDFNVSEAEARLRIRQMHEVFGILEFQLYDVMQGYSEPPSQTLQYWHTPCGNKLVYKLIIHTYLEEIAKIGGRSWLYVQAMGTDPGDKDKQTGFQVRGQHHCGRNLPLLDIVNPSADWAWRVAPAWIEFAAHFGFSGIHWDTLNSNGDLRGFLRVSGPLVHQRGLLQTCNFVGGQAWKDSLLTDNIVEFPYWEIWDIPVSELKFFKKADHWTGAVLAWYPGLSVSHDGEMQNQRAKGIRPLDVMIYRWARSRHRGVAYLAIGDGLRHVRSAYFPNTVPIDDAEIGKIRKGVFGRQVP